MIFLKTFDELIIGLGYTTFALPLINFLLGTIPAIFKRWIIDKKAFDEKCNFIKEKKFENVSILLYQIFFRGLNTDTPLRGQGQDHPDVVNPYHKSMYDCYNTVFKVNICFNFFRLLEHLSFWIAMLSIPIVILMLLKLFITSLVKITLGLILIELIITYLKYKKIRALEKLGQGL